MAALLAAALLAGACSSADDDVGGGGDDGAATGTGPSATDASSGNGDAGAGNGNGPSGGDTEGSSGSDTEGSSGGDTSGNGDNGGGSDSGTSDGNESGGNDSGGSGGDTGTVSAQAASLRSFDECGEVLRYIQAEAREAVGPWGLEGGGPEFGIAEGRIEGEAAITADQSASTEASSPQAGTDYSTSNIQEAGIDEPDRTKTDGRRLVAALGDRVHVVDVSGSEPRLVGSVRLGDQWVSQLLLHGDRVLAFSSGWAHIGPIIEPRAEGSDGPEGRWGPSSEVIEIDISGARPSIVRRLALEGSYVSARLTDGVVRIVTTLFPRAIPWAVPETADEPAQQRAIEANRELIDDTTIDNWLPQYTVTDASGGTVSSGRLGACDSVWAPQHFAGPGTLSVTTIDIAEEGLAAPLHTSSIMANGSTVYASPENLFVTTTQWADFARGFDDDEARVFDENNVARTEIHMFSTGSATESRYSASASVTGTVLNQYSMSEHQGFLRIATTTQPPWRADVIPQSQSLVTVLSTQNQDLEVVGQVGGLGPGERIFAVRYLGDIAAVVTFRQTDPLYMIDLSAPANPQVLGELKINGYSAYLHPINENLLLGVGQDATSEGRVTGTQVSLFDISDLANPTRVDQWSLRGAHSDVEFSALAFLYWRPLNLAVLPVNQFNFDSSVAEPPFLGAVALEVGDATLTERGRFSHADRPIRRCHETQEIIVNPDGSEQPGKIDRYCWYDYDWQAQVMSSVVVGDRLLLVSPRGLESISLSTLRRASLLRWPA